MPLLIWVVYRIAKAFAATGRLLFDVQLMRSLPWDYCGAYRAPTRGSESS
jgi:hypothetical protein